ncbi:hypothetical protein EXN66_Car011024 [Channa argus]|uniref:Uncharacterized protein n=1 Tax=Channa argus TaxID=215402 RepID=A0A6G1PZC2_CHAAH|nr:hypothetical protein EXN66_Car011024 [Channa argus]
MSFGIVRVINDTRGYTGAVLSLTVALHLMARYVMVRAFDAVALLADVKRMLN